MIDKVHGKYDVRDTLGTRFESKFNYGSANTLDLANIVYDNDGKNVSDMHNDPTSDQKKGKTVENFYNHPKHLRQHSKNTFRSAVKVQDFECAERNAEYSDDKSQAFEAADQEAKSKLGQKSAMTKSHTCFYKTNNFGQTTGNSFYTRPTSESMTHINQIKFEKYKKRPELFKYVPITKGDPSYNPKLICTKPRIDNLCMQFGKGSGRSYDMILRKNIKPSKNAQPALSLIQPDKSRHNKRGNAAKTSLNFQRS